MNKHITCLCFILRVIARVCAQQLQLNSLAVTDGLSQHDVSDIIRVSEEFIWMGTCDELNRFIVYEIEIFFYQQQ